LWNYLTAPFLFAWQGFNFQQLDPQVEGQETWRVLEVTYPDNIPACAKTQKIEKDGARPLGLSVDGVWCHKAFAGDRRLASPLLADFEPKVAPLTTAVLTSVDASHTGSASGLNSALARTGGLIATALLGGVLAERGAALLSGFHAGALVGATAAAAAGLFALLFVSNAEGVDQSCFLSAPNRRPTVWSLSGSRQIHRPEPNPNLTRWRARGTVRSRAYCLAFSSDGG
jgi:hypothetical protein